MNSVSFQEIQHNILSLQVNDCLREGNIAHTSQLLTRIYQWICDFFNGGTLANENREFDRLVNVLQNEITDLQSLLDQTDQEASFLQVAKRVRDLMKIESKINVTGWQSYLTKNQNFTHYKENMKNLRSSTKSRWQQIDNRVHPQSQKLKRWIFSDSFQRKYAMLSPTEELPYKAEEVPPGAILLTNFDSYRRGLEIRNFSLSLYQKVKQFQTFIIRLITGYPLIHSEISMGNGKVFHISKEDDQLVSGQGLIEDRGPIWNETKGKYQSAYYHKYEILMPNEDAWLNAYNETALEENRLASFQDLLNVLFGEIRENGSKFKADAFSISKMFFRFARNPNENPSQVLKYNDTYSCSGCLSSLFAKYGIDIGKEFNLPVKRVSPTEFYKSKFFKKWYSSIAE